MRNLLGSARVRILASYLVLLLFSTVVGGIALRSVLLARAGERVDDALVQETEEFRTLADMGRNPRTGKPFGDDVQAIFNLFLSRNVPGAGRGLLHVRRRQGAPRDVCAGRRRAERRPDQRRRGRRLGQRRVRGRRPPDPLPVGARARRWRPGRRLRRHQRPVQRDRPGQQRPARGGGDRAGRLPDRVAARVGRGRARARPAAGAARHRSLDQRERPHASHPGRGGRRAGRPGPHLQRDAGPPRGCVREPEGVHQRRRPRAAHADHDRARAPRAARERIRPSARRRSSS